MCVGGQGFGGGVLGRVLARKNVGFYSEMETTGGFEQRSDMILHFQRTTLLCGTTL